MPDDPPWLRSVATADELFATPFAGERNVVRWVRTLPGDFAEIARLVDGIESDADRVEVHEDTLRSLRRAASDGGRAAIDVLQRDLALLRERGHEPQLEWLRRYRRDDDPDLPTDVHSFHVDTANVPTETILCTYFGAPSEVLPRRDALPRLADPALRSRLRARFAAERTGLTAADADAAFAEWLRERFFDLHFEPRAGAGPWSCGVGALCRLAVQHPGAAVPAAVHRAPPTLPGATGRLLLIS